MVDPHKVRIGSGQIAAIAGVSRFKKPIDVWSELLGYTSSSESEQIDIGLELEEPIANLASRQQGLGQFIHGETHEHLKEKWAKATPDWILIDRGYAILETKNVGASPGPVGALEDWRQDHELVVPDYVVTQVQWQAEVCDRDVAFVAALLAGREVFVRRFERDKQFGADLMEIARDFRERYILTNMPPSAPDGSEAYERYLRGRFPRASGEWITATQEDEQLLLRLRGYQAAKKHAETEEKKTRQAIEERIGERQGIIGARQAGLRPAQPGGMEMSHDSQALAVRQKSLKELLLRSQGALQGMIPKHLTAERLVRIAISSALHSPKLLACSAQSILLGVMQAAVLGLEVGNGLGHAYLVAYKTTAQMIVGYRGYVDLALRSGKVQAVEARAAHEGDKFDYTFGLHPYLMHKPTGDEGAEFIAAYAIARMGNISEFDVMEKPAIERIRTRSRAKDDGPWVTDYDEMAKKTVVRRLAKLLPVSVEFAAAVELDNRADGVEAKSNDIIDLPVPELEPVGTFEEPTQSTAKEKVAAKAAEVRGEEKP